MHYAYVGCRTTKERGARGKGIKVYAVQHDGSWVLHQTIATDPYPNPSYLCLDQEKDYLYTLHGDSSEVSSYRLAADGTLRYLNTVSCCGLNPVHLSVDRANQNVYIANLQSGNISVIRRELDGRLGQLVQYVSIPGKAVATASHPHQVNQDQLGKHLIVSVQGRLQGRGGVHVFSIGENGLLSPADVLYGREKAEPRHTVMHPENRFCYGVNEKDCTVTFYLLDNGQLNPQQIVSTLRDTYVGEGWSSGIVMAPNGKFLYVSDRKQNSVSCLSINQDTGKLTFVGDYPTRGEQPRFICLDHEGKRLLAANELSDSICFFDMDPLTGGLKYAGLTVATETPVCVVFR